MCYVSLKYSCLHCILQLQISLFEFSNTNTFSFSFILQVIIHIVGTTILSGINVDCVFLASHNNRHNHIHNNRKWLKQPQSHFHQPFFGLLMYSLYSHPNFNLKQKCHQYGLCFQTVFLFLMTMIQHTMSDANNLMLLQYSIKS